MQDARIEGHPPYELIPVGPVPSTGNFDATDKLELSSIVDQKLRHGVGIYVGQSNGAAFLGVQEPPYRTVRPENRMLDIHSGRVFRTSDPVLGCDGSYQFIGSRIADHLIASNVFDVFTNVPIAIGGTDIGEWAYGGCSHRVVCCAARLRDKGYKASFVNLIIGENNQSTSAEVFATAGRDLVRLFRSHGIECPFIVNQVSFMNGVTSDTARAGQRMMIDRSAGIFFGVDWDSYKGIYRSPNSDPHLSAAGAEVVARASIGPIVAALMHSTAPPNGSR